MKARLIVVLAFVWFATAAPMIGEPIESVGCISTSSESNLLIRMP